MMMAQAREDQPSCIMAMHHRYEATQTEYFAIEAAEAAERRRTADREDLEGLADSYANGLRSLAVESDILRSALLYQVPDNWAEALILQFHIVNAFDMQVASDTPDEKAWVALQLAIDTLFDFMCCTAGQDHAAIGSSFQDGALRAFRQRRHRTGVVKA